MLTVACGSGGATGAQTGASAESHKPASAIVNDAQSCLSTAHSVHVHAELELPDGSHTIDVDTRANGDATGTTSGPSGTIEVILIGHGADAGGRTYVNAAAGFWGNYVSQASAAALANTWVMIPSSSAPDEAAAGVAEFTAYPSLASSLTPGGAAASFGRATTPDGRASIKLSEGGVLLFVNDSPAPCPLYVLDTATAGGQGTGHLAFSRYNSGPRITPPAQATALPAQAAPGP